MKIEMIIPNNDNDGSDNTQVIESAVKEMCALYGGVTAYQAQGYWANAMGRLYKDDVTVLVSAALESDHWDDLRELGRLVLKNTDQEAVFIARGDKAEILE